MDHFIEILIILACGYLAISLFSLLQGGIYRYCRRAYKDTVKLRKIKTRFHLARQIFNVLALMATVLAVLMTFENIKNLGMTLLASAGALGLILGFAAQKSLSALFAGIQIALAQPIRIGDVVIIQDQFGTIGEITLTYVVVHIWDGRRLIVPINFFLENTFETWTRVSPEVIAKVRIRADYSLPVDKIRAEFHKWIDSSALWDKRTAALLVTGADSHTIELRATISAKDADDAWDLQCFIREKLIAHIRENYPQALPQTRLVLSEKSPLKRDSLN